MAACLAVWLTVCSVAAAGGVAALDRALFDRFLAGAPAPAAPEDVIVVAIDAPSFQAVGRPWPWPRATHAELVDAARRAGARQIVFDIVFDQPSPDDEAFAAANEAFGNVVLATERSVQRTRYGVIETLIGPSSPIAESARAVGRSDLPVDPDGRARRMPGWPDAMAYVAEGAAPPRGEALIRWRAPSAPIRRVSYYQALEPERFLPPGALEGATLFVGLALDASPVVRAAQTDRLAAPISYDGSVFVTGVEAHANVFATARAGDALHQAPGGVVGFLVLIALGLTVAGAVLLVAQPVLAISLELGGAAFLALLSFAALAGSGSWVPIAAPLLALSVCGACHGAMAFIRTRRERVRLARGLARYVAPALLNRVLRDPSALNLGGERREVTALVTDLEGFTSLMERIDPVRQADILRDYLGGVSAVVLDAQGLVDQFVGDAMIALFNALTPQPDHAARAIACALQIDAFAQAFRDELRAQGVAFGATRIGIESGAALVGNFGSNERFHYTAMGDVTNVGSRLEKANKTLGTRILIGANAAALAPEALRPAARLHVPGRSAAIDAFAPIAGLSGAAAEAYLGAHRALAQGEGEAAELFAAASALAPDDALTNFHRERIAQGIVALDVETTKS